jgi:serine-type D-Ala-D-Ala carboxypeptidase (penicillin-binding protein 5/6)
MHMWFVNQFILVTLLFLTAFSAHAASEAELIARAPSVEPNYDSLGQYTTKASFAFLYDYTTGTILYEKNAFQPMGPSSMTKLMTAYLVFEALKKGRVNLNTTFPISKKAFNQEGTKMFAKLGSQVTVDNLLRGAIVHSGNDACVALAEGLAGSEPNFVRLMNEKAKQLGLEHTNLRNTNGLPDPAHTMSAADLVRLAVRLYEDFPEYMKYYSLTEFTYNGIRQPSRNRLLHRGIGVDGFKTGFTRANGYGITVTSEQNGRRVFLVVNGLKTGKERLEEAERLVRHAFKDFRVVQLYSQGQEIDKADVWLGSSPNVPLVTAQPVRLTIPTDAYLAGKKPNYQIQISYNSPLYAPVAKGDPVATMYIMKDGKALSSMPLLAKYDISKQNVAQQVVPKAKYMMSGSY